jgi:hypothetical protein
MGKPKQTGRTEPQAGASDRAKKTKTCQVFEDEAYWLSLLAAFRKTSIAKVLSPLIREDVRKMLREEGTDPDAAWERNLRRDEED